MCADRTPIGTGGSRPIRTSLIKFDHPLKRPVPYLYWQRIICEILAANIVDGLTKYRAITTTSLRRRKPLSCPLIMIRCQTHF